MSLRSSSQQPPGIHICQMRLAPAENQIRHEGSVTRAVPLGHGAAKNSPPLQCFLGAVLSWR